MSEELLIGIDGGGTHSTAVAVTMQGRTAAVARGGGLNFLNDGIPVVKERLEEMVRALLEQCPGATLRKVCAGMAALDQPGDEETHARFTGELISRAQLDLQSDADIALIGFTKGEPGMIVICGTGSMLLMLDDQGRKKVAGGWGYLLGDAGSGYTLAREGLRGAIAFSEGMGRETALMRAAMDFFGIGEMRKLIDCVYAPGVSPREFAGFARCVLQAAEEGDGVAKEIVGQNMRLLAAQAALLAKNSPKVRRVGLYGGIFCHSRLALNAFTEALRALAPHLEAAFPEYPPELGAVIHLMRREGICTEEALKTMKNTYEEMLKNERD